MSLTSISLRNVRKHSDIKINFAKGLNYIVGRNGLGKTTILESIYYLCTTKSCCTKSDANVVKFSEDSFEISGVFESGTKDNAVVSYSISGGRKYYYLNAKQVVKPSSVIGKFPVVMLSPADHSITLGAPVERRKFVDSVISQTSRAYLEVLLEYQKILKHRSSILTRIKEGSRNEEDELEIWNQKLIAEGEQIINYKIKFLSDFQTFMSESYYRIMGEREYPRIKYFYLGGYSGNNIADKFSEILDESREDEIRRAANLVGPHRDEFVFEISGINLREFGSQGQHKTFQAVLRFAEFFYIKNITGVAPLFLLDDVFGELDTWRAFKVSEYLGEINGQAFVTLTDFGNFSFLKSREKDAVILINEEGGVNYA